MGLHGNTGISIPVKFYRLLVSLKDFKPIFDLMVVKPISHSFPIFWGRIKKVVFFRILLLSADVDAEALNKEFEEYQLLEDETEDSLKTLDEVYSNPSTGDSKGKNKISHVCKSYGGSVQPQ